MTCWPTGILCVGVDSDLSFMQSISAVHLSAWFLVSTNWEKKGSRTGVTTLCCTKLWPSYCTISGVQLTLPKLNSTSQCIPHTHSSLDLTSNPTRELSADPITEFPVKGSTKPTQQQSYNTMTHKTNTSIEAMENPASIGEETYTEEDATATPPGDEITQVPHSQFHYPGLMVPYVEGPKMDWTTDDTLHSRSVQWKIKCENILDCELSILQESVKCKKVIHWSGDVGRDMYISWAMYSRFEEFCKPQSNAVCAWFDLLTSFWQGNRSIDE